MPRPRRKSGSLGGDLRGDTGTALLSTLTSPPTFPRSSQSKVIRTHSKGRKARGLFRRWRDFSIRHTWANPLILILLVLSAYLVNPAPTNPLHSAIFISYALPRSHPSIALSVRLDPSAPTHYGKGRRDFVFVAFYIVVLSFTREFLMQRLIRPIAIHYGIRSRAKQNRFMEQAYTAIYFAVFGPLGLLVMSRTPVWYFNTEAMFEGFPHITNDGLLKAYYLLQASYWAQQAIVLCLLLEKPRKDFKELVGHHVITLALIWLSYRFHFTYIGLAVYITHDISDFFLATSKTLNYLSSPIVIPYFALFIAVWIYLRHYINLVILYATLTKFRTVGPFELDWEAEQFKCSISQVITFLLLATLQSINLFWLYFIIRVALRMVFANVVEDVRSDDEDDEEVEGGKEKQRGEERGVGKVSGALEKVEGVGEGKKDL